MSTKKMIAIISGLLAVIITAGVIFFATETQQPNQQTDTKFMGLLNSHVLDAITPISAEERHAEESARPQLPSDVQGNIELTVEQQISQGNFSKLDEYLLFIDSTYQDTDTINDIRIDIANTYNLTPENSQMFFTSYKTPDVLVGAILYTPISCKLGAFVNANSLIFPSITDMGGAPNVNLRELPLTDEEKTTKLVSLNDGKVSYEQYSDIARYQARVWGVPCLFWAVKGEYGWMPYLLEQETNYTINTMTQREVQTIANNLYGSRDTIDSVLVTQPFDEQAYLDYMAEHPEEFNEDGSRKGMDTAPVDDGTNTSE